VRVHAWYSRCRSVSYTIDAVRLRRRVGSENRGQAVGGGLPVIGGRELIVNKKAVGRPQDLADVARLESEPPTAAG
jgi:hypothetical protein